jgi:hypothetical protein
MDVVDFARRVYKLLGEREEDIKEMLASGSPRNWEQYQSLVGEIRGVAFAREEIKALLEKSSDHESISS